MKILFIRHIIILRALLILMIGNGLRNIGRNAEFYLYIMAFSLIAIVTLGIFIGDYQRLLPVLDINITQTAPKLFKYFGWFMDPVMLLFLIGNIKDENKSVKPFIITHIVCAVFVVFGMATFYAINEYMVEFQSNGLTSMTEFTLIKLGVGRPDWFLVLFVNIANVIVVAFLVWIIVESLVQIFNKKVNYTYSAVVLLAVHLLDEFVYKNLEISVLITTKYASVFMIAYAILIPIALICSRKKINTNSAKEVTMYE